MAAAATVLVAAVTALAAAPSSSAARAEVGAFGGPGLGEGWSRSARADVDRQATTDGRTAFHYRGARPNARLRLPVTCGGPFRLRLRASARVRAAVGVFVEGRPVGEALVRPDRWDVYTVEGGECPADGEARGLELSLAQRPLPLVPGEHVQRPEILVDYVELEGVGLHLGRLPRLLAVLAPLAAGLLAATAGVRRPGVVLSASLGGLLAVAAYRADAAAAVQAAPRLVPVAFGAGLLALAALRAARVEAGARRALTLMVAGGTLAHGSVAFFPEHVPPDLDIHVRRTTDLGTVPLTRDGLRRYSSQLPTPSQDQGHATAALGERTLIPYSPLPYVFFYALHRARLDLYWALTVFSAALAMLVAPLLWWAAARIWGAGAAWTAVALYALDLAVWHHLGRVHAPAVFGAALGTAALLLLAARADDLERAQMRAVLSVALALAALGYSSMVVLMGLFGAALLALLALDARGLTPAARRGMAIALVAGGLLAGALFYFHYVPGLLQGARGVEAEPDLFPGRRFLVFRNESRQAMRLWALGLGYPVALGVACAPFALRRARPFARPVLLAWLLAWAMILVLKDPVFFPKLLRWAKEDEFVSPLLALFAGGAVWALPRARWRWAAATLLIALALALEVRDFAHHANTLRL